MLKSLRRAMAVADRHVIESATATATSFHSNEGGFLFFEIVDNQYDSFPVKYPWTPWVLGKALNEFDL